MHEKVLRALFCVSTSLSLLLIAPVCVYISRFLRISRDRKRNEETTKSEEFIMQHTAFCM